MANAKKNPNPAPIPLPKQPPKPTSTLASGPITLSADIVGTPAYIRTASDTAAVSVFLADFRAYDKQTHNAAASAHRMMAHGLHEREGVENFGNWCSREFASAGILHIDGRRAYQLAQVGELLAKNNNAPELLALPSRALTAIAQALPDFEEQGLTAVEVAAALPDFQKAQKIGDSVKAVQTLAEYGIDGDPRNDTQRKEDQRAEAEFTWMLRGYQMTKSVKKAEGLAARFVQMVKDTEAEAAKTKNKKAKRTTTKRNG